MTPIYAYAGDARIRTARDFEWLAGLFEGEGCFGVYHRKDRPPTNTAVRMRVAMTDEDVIAKAARLLGYNYHESSPTRSGKRVWQVQMTGRKAAGWMMTLYSLMGSRRRTAIRSALALWRNIPVTGRTRAAEHRFPWRAAS